MEKARIEEIESELSFARERFGSARDDIEAERFRSATSSLYFTLEHLAKALLLTVGIEVRSHQGIFTMLGKHFVKPGRLPVRMARQLGNLYERRITAEYSRRAGWEFTDEEVATYLGWVKFSANALLKELKAAVPELSDMVSSLKKEIDQQTRGAYAPEEAKRS